MNHSTDVNRRIKNLVQSRYEKCAKSATVSACCTVNGNYTSGFAQKHGLYTKEELADIPLTALHLSRGCGNPTGFAALKKGEQVVDFGCGAGVDVILAAKKVHPNGNVVGIDFSLAMIEKAGQATEEAGVADYVNFIMADLDDSGLCENFADIVISNCVINLCPNKEKIYQEMFRILKPGGRIAISDVIYTENIDIKTHERFKTQWSGCVGGAIEKSRYFDIVKSSGFTEIEILFEHLLSSNELSEMACCPGKEYAAKPLAEDLAVAKDKIESVKFTARKSGGNP